MNKISFLINTAIRDSRKNRAKLALFMSSIVLGVAALVAINSFNYNLRNEIDREAATLLGADLAATSNKVADPEILKILDSLPGERAREMEMLSMSYIPRTDETQFVRIKALQGNFPFYGKIKTDPPQAASRYKDGPYALVDESLMIQHQLKSGDSIKLGKMMFEIKGKLNGAVGSVGAASAVAPAIYISIQSLDSTGLVLPGSLINYAYYYKVPKGFNVEKWKSSRKKLFRSESLRVETIEDRKENLNQAFGFLNNFLNLVAIVALLLGCIGVASSVFIYIKSKYNSIALLRCIGLKSNDAFMVYFVQIMSLGLIGVVSGVIGGVFIQTLLPFVLKDFLPVQVNMGISTTAILQGFLIGMVITSMFSLVPLLSIRSVSPLRILRSSVEEKKSSLPLLSIGLYMSIVFMLMLFMWLLTGSLLTGSLFVVGIIVTYLLLTAISAVVTRSLRKMIPERVGFILKQGISILFRPDNQTQTIMVTIGMGTAILTTMIILQSLLLNNVSLMDEGKQPNMILYGIETHQMEGLKSITRKYGLPVIQEVPIVTMKIDAWKGKTKSQWMADSTMNSKRWAANREARVTYRDTVSDDEKLISGSLKKYNGGNDSIFVSLGTTFAEALDVKIGDEIVFNVQGTRMVTYVGSLREIEFRNLSTRFFIVFPSGVLEKAPQFQVLVTKAPDNKTISSYRSEVVKTFPNVSVVDLTTILESVNDILQKVAFIIRFMAIFSLLTGLIVLISSLLLSKYQRLKESILLRTIGATKAQIMMINVTEYSILGSLAAGTGIMIAIVAAFILTKFQFKLDFDIDWIPVVLVFVLVVVVTILTGLLNSQSIVNSPPLEVLRKEDG